MAAETESRGDSRFAKMSVIADSNATPDDVKEYYDIWAEEYIEDLTSSNYFGPRLGAEKLSSFFPVKDGVRIVDCGCGTGMVGIECHKLGFKHIDGIDFSKKSIEVSRSKKVYTKLICDLLGEKRLNIPNDTYDAVICIGTFIPGHVNQSVFPEFIRIVKPGGYIVIGMRAEFLEMGSEFCNGQLTGAMQRMADENEWEWIETEEIPLFVAGKSGFHYVFRVL